MGYGHIYIATDSEQKDDLEKRMLNFEEFFSIEANCRLIVSDDSQNSEDGSDARYFTKIEPQNEKGIVRIVDKNAEVEGRMTCIQQVNGKYYLVYSIGDSVYRVHLEPREEFKKSLPDEVFYSKL